MGKSVLCRRSICLSLTPTQPRIQPSAEESRSILKRERYYGKRFTNREALVSTIENYITYYNNRRVQRNLGVLTPMEKHNNYLLAA